MKLLIVITLCVFSVVATDFAERLQKVIDENTERVADEIWPAEYLANMNATNIKLKVKSDVKRNQYYYQQEANKYIRQLKRLVDDKGAVAKKCTKGKGEEVVAISKQVQLNLNVCTEKAEKFCTGLQSAFTGEFKRILEVCNKKSINIISYCVKNSGNEDKAELCVIFRSGSVKDEALNLVQKLQTHLKYKFDEINYASYRCRTDISSKAGFIQKIASNDKEIKACIEASS